MLGFFCNGYTFFLTTLVTAHCQSPRFLIGPKHNMTQEENGVLWKLFLLSMLLQGRRDADTRRTGGYKERVTRRPSCDVCVSVGMDCFSAAEARELGCLLHPAE